jgi:hypothetical protein
VELQLSNDEVSTLWAEIIEDCKRPPDLQPGEMTAARFATLTGREKRDASYKLVAMVEAGQLRVEDRYDPSTKKSVKIYVPVK